MTDGEALLRTILERPDDDTARLVYADWLEDVSGGNDAARAEFIRVQCKYHTWRPSALCVHNSKPHYRFKPSKRCGISTDNPAHNCACRFELFRVRERELWADQVRAAHDGDGRLWGLPVERVTVPSKSAPRTYSEETYVVERGFVAHVFASLAAFVQHAEALFRAHPIERVTLTDRQPYYNGAGWCWFNGQRKNKTLDVPATAELPEPLFDKINAQSVYSPGRIALFHTEGKATEALPPACVAYGRKLAGLSPLA